MLSGGGSCSSEGRAGHGTSPSKVGPLNVDLSKSVKYPVISADNLKLSLTDVLLPDF